MSNSNDSKKYRTNKRLQYVNQLSINGQMLEVVVQTNNPLKYFWHKAIGNLSLLRGKSYRYRG